jgi:hypothetical protein
MFMKVKKLISTACALVMACACAATTLSACSNQEEHVYKWTVKTPATCVAEGEDEGFCGICGDVVYRVTDIDPDNHAFGDWQITVPTESSVGKAVKICTLNGEHKKEVELPVLTESGEGYTSATVTTAATALKDGVKTYVLADDEGDISFDVSVPAHGVISVSDAVEVALSNASAVRRTEGKTGYYYYSSSGDQTHINDFNCEFGDNYAHIYDDGDRVERWYSLDENGEAWGFKREQGSLIKETNADYMQGYRFSLTRSGSFEFFGAENLLEGMYERAQTSTNGDFYESITESNGVKTYKFSFGHLNLPDYFCKIEVSFTLDNDNVLKTFELNSTAYVNRDDALYYSHTWDIDRETGIASVVDYEGTRYVDHIEFTQTTIKEAEAAGEEVPVNPYDKASVLYKSFDVKSGSKVYGDDDVINITANVTTVFSITNKQPSTAKDSFDAINCYYLTDNGEIEVNYGTESSVGIVVNYISSSSSLQVRSKIAGKIVIILRTTNYEKRLTFNVARIAPTKLSPAVYEYGNEGYYWNTTTATSLSATAYINSPLRFKAKTPVDESAYADSAYTVEVTSDNADKVTMTRAQLNGEEVTEFVATETGFYTLKLTSTFSNSISCTITIEVQSQPPVSSILRGSYYGKIEYPEADVTVTFTPSADPSKGTVTIAASGTQEILNFSYENGVLTTSHRSGVDCGFTLSVNEAFCVVLSHPDNFDGTETIILERSSES